MSRISLGPGGEFDRIRRFLADAAPLPPGVLVGPGDDAAVLAPDLVLSTDLAIEGVHFRLDWIEPHEAGGRAVAAALSDLAAMAADLVGVAVSIAVPPGSGAAEGIMEGARAAVEARGGALLGGDLARSPGPLLLDVVAVGRTAAPLLRSGARPGDELWVTGILGGAAAAVVLWQRGERPAAPLRAAHARPEPRLGPARWLVEEVGARAGLDLSDGIAGDAAHLAAASGVAVRLEAGALPVHPAIASSEGSRDLDALSLALHGGDDFELLVAVPPGGISPARVEEFTRRFDLLLSRVGTAVEGSGVLLVPPGGGEPRPLTRGGYDHFGDGEEE